MLHSCLASVVRQHLWGGALRDDTKNGCVADYTTAKHTMSKNRLIWLDGRD